ncbi:MAG: toll/interleukin-1 receptor domain-containing protein [Anaerolineae bacterium]|nr:toll/interleukin-1 receptor domain-containing protein [Anaerolineae bacterium]
MSHIFISYSHHDAAVYVQLLSGELEKRGFRCWFDKRIDTGERWFKSIISAIEESSSVVVVMTPGAVRSEWVEKEILIAQKNSKPIYPLLLAGRGLDLLITTQYEDVTRGQLPSETFFSRLRSPLSVSSSPHHKIEEIKTVLRDLIEAAHLHLKLIGEPPTYSEQQLFGPEILLSPLPGPPTTVTYRFGLIEVTLTPKSQVFVAYGKPDYADEKLRAIYQTRLDELPKSFPKHIAGSEYYNFGEGCYAPSLKEWIVSMVSDEKGDIARIAITRVWNVPLTDFQFHLIAEELINMNVLYGISEENIRIAMK